MSEPDTAPAVALAREILGCIERSGLPAAEAGGALVALVCGVMQQILEALGPEEAEAAAAAACEQIAESVGAELLMVDGVGLEPGDGAERFDS